MFNMTVTYDDEGGLDANFGLHIFLNNLIFTFLYSDAFFVRILHIQSNAPLSSLSIASCLASQDQ